MEKDNIQEMNKADLIDHCRFLRSENTRKDEEIKKLKEQVNAGNEERRRLKDEMVQNSVMNRWKVGEYLHDNLGQKLSFAKMLISLAKKQLGGRDKDITAKMDEVILIVDEAAREIRDLSHEIIPVDIEEEGFSQALGLLVEQAEKREGIKCNLKSDKILQEIDDSKTASDLYHIAQEAVKNATLHGEAKNIEVTVTEDEESLSLYVKDDGKGFEETDAGGMGINIMKHRAARNGGTFTIVTGKEVNGYSTCVTCRLPLKNIRKLL